MRASDRAATAGLAAFVVGFWLLRTVLAPVAGPSNRPDLFVYYLPLYETSFEWLRGGGLPAWNPHHLTGLPWLGTLQTGFFYPPHVVYALLPVEAGLAVGHVLHLLLLALSMAAFARAAGTSRPAAALAALGVLIHGPALASLAYPPLLEAMAWLPLGCVGVLRLGEGERRGAVLLALATGMSLLAGFPQATVLCGYAWATLWLAQRLGRPAPLGAWLRSAAAFAGALGVGVLLSAVQLLPAMLHTLEAARQTEVLSAGRAIGMGTTSWNVFQRAVLVMLTASAVALVVRSLA